MRLCLDALDAASPLSMEKQGLDLSTSSGPGPGPGPGLGPGLHAALAPLGALSGSGALSPLGSLGASLGALGPLGPLSSLARPAAGAAATLNLSVNLPLHVPSLGPLGPLPPYLKELFLASLIRGESASGKGGKAVKGTKAGKAVKAVRDLDEHGALPRLATDGIYQPAGPLISAASVSSAGPTAGQLLAPMVTPSKAGAGAAGAAGAAPGRASPPPSAPRDGGPPSGRETVPDAAPDATGGTSTPGAPPGQGSMPPPAYRYPPAPVGAYHAPPYYGQYPQPYYSAGAAGPTGPPYQEPCYPGNYYQRALYRRHYSYLAGPAADPYAPGAPPLGPPPPPPTGAPMGAAHQMQMVLSSGPPAAPGPHGSHPEYAVDPYGHYSAYPPGPETATFRCPCPMQSCPKNVHTGPLTGDGKGPKPMSLTVPAVPAVPAPPSLPPVALALPNEPPTLPPGIIGPPSPARGSAGMPPPPSPAAGHAAGATHHFHAWDSVEGSQSVVKQDPGTPPEGPTEPPALVLATRHNLNRQNVPPPAAPLAPAPLSTPRAASPASTPSRRLREHRHKKTGGASPAGDLSPKNAATKNQRDAKGGRKDVKEEISTTTIEEATQTTPPPQAGSTHAMLDSGKRMPTSSCQGSQDGEAPPKKKKKVGTRNAAETATSTESQPDLKSNSSKSKKKSSSAAADGPDAATAVPEASSSRAKTATGKRAAKNGAKRAQKRTPSLDSVGSGKRAKSQDKSRDSSRNRSRSSSRGRVSEEEEAAAAVVAAAGLPEGVPLNQCRRLIAAQKRLISKCQAKKEREEARLARQEAARAARLAALVSAAEAKKTTPVPDPDDASDGRPDETGQDKEPESNRVPPTSSAATAATAIPPVAGLSIVPVKHPHLNNNLGDGVVDRRRVEELGSRAGLTVPSCLCISQSELRLLESCAEPKTPKWSNGWQWRGQPFLHRVFLNCDDPPVLRKCFPAMQHVEGDNITLGDTVLLKSGTRKIDLPFVARVIHLWENPEDGEMMLSLVWFYRPEHTEQGRKPCDRDDEIFSSRHKDINSVACIEDKCYVLTFNEYCRYRKTIRRLEEGLSPPSLVVPSPDGKYPRHHRLPPGHVAPDMVFFCRKIYDFRQRRLQKNVF